MWKAWRPKIENPKEIVRIGFVAERDLKDDFDSFCNRKWLNMSTYFRSHMISELEKEKEKNKE